MGAAGEVGFLQEGHVPGGVKGESGTFGVEKDLEEGEEEDSTRRMGLPAAVGGRGREHGFPGKVVGEGDPALVRGALNFSMKAFAMS